MNRKNEERENYVEKNNNNNIDDYIVLYKYSRSSSWRDICRESKYNSYTSRRE